MHMAEEPSHEPSGGESLGLGCGRLCGPEPGEGSQHFPALHSGATSLPFPKSVVGAWMHSGCQGGPRGSLSRGQETDALRAQCLMILRLPGRLGPEWFQEGGLGHPCLMHWLPVVPTPDVQRQHSANLCMVRALANLPPVRTELHAGCHMLGSCLSSFRPLAPQHRGGWAARLAPQAPLPTPS